MRAVLLALAMFSLAAPSFAKPKARQKAPAAKKIKVVRAKVEAMHNAKVKRDLGLPTAAFGSGYSHITTKWHDLKVSPPVDGWVTDYDEAEGSAYRVRLSRITFPGGEKRSLYTDDQKTEVFKNMIGHLYNLKGPALAKVLGGAEGKALFEKFKEGIDEGGFDFPMALTAPR